ALAQRGLQTRVRLPRMPEDHGIAQAPGPDRMLHRRALDVSIAQVSGTAEAFLTGARVDVLPLLGEIVERRQVAQGQLDARHRARRTLAAGSCVPGPDRERSPRLHDPVEC